MVFLRLPHKLVVSWVPVWVSWGVGVPAGEERADWLDWPVAYKHLDYVIHSYKINVKTLANIAQTVEDPRLAQLIRWKLVDNAGLR